MSLSDDAWSEVASHLGTLSSMALARVSDVGDDDRGSESVPSDDDFKEAVRVIGERASAAFGSLAESIHDPDIRAETKQVASAIRRALTVSFSELATRYSQPASGTSTADRPAGEAEETHADGTET